MNLLWKPPTLEKNGPAAAAVAVRSSSPVSAPLFGYSRRKAIVQGLELRRVWVFHRSFVRFFDGHYQDPNLRNVVKQA